MWVLAPFMTSRCHCRIILSSPIPTQRKAAVCDSMEEFLNNLYAWSVLTRLCNDGIFLMSVAVGFLPSLPCAFDLLNTSWMIFPYILTSCCILRTGQIVGRFSKASFNIIKPEVWIINHCLGLGHETMVCAVCLTMFLSSNLLSKYHLFYSCICPCFLSNGAFVCNLIIQIFCQVLCYKMVFQ